MTTFQVLLESFLKALTLILPISESQIRTLTVHLLNWTLPFSEIELIIFATASFALLLFFRYDWLGLLSAGITTLFRPMSIRSESRNLDQHSLMFLLISFLPVALLHLFLEQPLIDSSVVSPSLLAGGGLLLTGFGFLASSRWNKRIHGLNHLRLSHAFAIALAGGFSMMPGFPLVGLLWIGFAFCNYHYEAIGKYSGLLVGLGVFSKTISLLQSLSLREAFERVGYLNSTAVVVIGFTVVWICLEHLQKSLSETSFKNFQWLSIVSGTVLFILYFAGFLPE
ncbi:MAG: hypothetical protein KGP28_03940 [Bdellovibrionales bacterium]|nr:hypothetical protein [Bdellovibrionales bacterium]